MIKLNINGKTVQADVEPEMPLLWVLRDVLDMKGTKFGCGLGQCGECRRCFHRSSRRARGDDFTPGCASFSGLTFVELP